MTRKRDDEGSMPMAMLVVLISMSLTAALVPMVISQVLGTRTVAARTTALDVAQAGIDAAVAQIRSALKTVTDTDGNVITSGDVSSLPPCSMTGLPYAGGPKYSVRLVYYGLPASAVDDTQVKFDCPPTDVPSTAILTSTGASTVTPGAPVEGTSGTRTIQATYTFKINNENLSGGAIQLAEPAVNPLCVDGGDNASPSPGDKATMQLCPDGGTGSQRFVYTSDLNIMLSGSATTTSPKGMCLTADYASAAPVTFQACTGRTPKQQWSLDNNSRFQATPDGVKLESKYCLNATNAGKVGALDLEGCGTATNKSVFRMQASVGAGMASAATNQLVNYKQFSRCLDVTNLNQKSDYMIVWFCKQAPNGAVAWNQQWSLPVQSLSLATATPGPIRSAGNDGKGYCLTPPASTSGYVTLTACSDPAAVDKTLRWTVYGNTLDYNTSYRIVSSSGYCLTPTDLTVPSPDTHSDGTARVKIAACSGDLLQKWNAPANFNKPLSVTNTLEK